jgi:hypothetical protein
VTTEEKFRAAMSEADLRKQNEMLKGVLLDALHKLKDFVMFGQDFARHHEYVCDPGCARLKAWREVFIK